MSNHIGYIPTPLLRQILGEWCKRHFNWTDKETEVVINATREQIYNEARHEILVEYKNFLTRVVKHPALTGRELARDAKLRLEELEQVLEDN